MSSPKKVVMSWSGGKDSAMALYHVLQQPELSVVKLLTTVAGQYGRVSHHGVRESLLDDQSEAIGIPLQKMVLPASSTDQPCTILTACMNRK